VVTSAGRSDVATLLSVSEPAPPVEPPAELAEVTEVTEAVTPAKPVSDNLRVGILTTVAALGGALIVALTTLYATDHQTSSQASQDRSDFLRTQRQAAYAQLIGDGSSFEKLADDCIIGGTTSSATTATATIAAQNSSLVAQLRIDAANIVIIGSSKAAVHALDMAADADGVESYCQASLTAGGENQPLAASVQLAGRTARDNLTNDTAALIEQARSDLHGN
jgi:hypothetical protein